jgi:3-oxoacyl-[acyl-carrier-protein] synthase II
MGGLHLRIFDLQANRHRVIVTGIGLVTAIGQDYPTTWANLLAGKSGIKLACRPPFPDTPIPLAIADNPPAESIESSQPRAQRLVLQAVLEAIADAALVLPLPNCGIVVGSSRANQLELEATLSGNLSKSGFPWLSLLPGSIASLVAAHVQTQSVVLAPMAACATGNWAIAQAYEAIQMGQCDLAIAAAVDAPITPLSIAGFHQIGAMARTGLYPFSREREGLVLGEGAAAIVMESERSLQQRQKKAHIDSYGEILGFGITNDAWHPTSPDPQHIQAERAIQTCLDRVGILTRDVDHLNLHGTGTQRNDAAEAALVGRVFPHAPFVSATKGATGHVLGATGMIEAIFCLLSLQQQVLPPCIGMRSPDFDLNFTRTTLRTERRAELEIALNLSFGFGGQNAVVAFGRS